MGVPWSWVVAIMWLILQWIRAHLAACLAARTQGSTCQQSPTPLSQASPADVCCHFSGNSSVLWSFVKGHNLVSWSCAWCQVLVKQNKDLFIVTSFLSFVTGRNLVKAGFGKFCETEYPFLFLCKSKQIKAVNWKQSLPAHHSHIGAHPIQLAHGCSLYCKMCCFTHQILHCIFQTNFVKPHVGSPHTRQCGLPVFLSMDVLSVLMSSSV